MLSYIQALWKHKRVPQLVVDRNAQTDDTFIAASRLTMYVHCCILCSPN
jgi:hypothetical protein